MYGLPKFPLVHWIFISHISIFLGWLKAALYQATRIWLRAEIRIWLQSAERTATFDAATPIRIWRTFCGPEKRAPVIQNSWMGPQSSSRSVSEQKSGEKTMVYGRYNEKA